MRVFTCFLLLLFSVFAVQCLAKAKGRKQDDGNIRDSEEDNSHEEPCDISMIIAKYQEQLDGDMLDQIKLKVQNSAKSARAAMGSVLDTKLNKLVQAQRQEENDFEKQYTKLLAELDEAAQKSTVTVSTTDLTSTTTTSTSLTSTTIISTIQTLATLTAISGSTEKIITTITSTDVTSEPSPEATAAADFETTGTCVTYASAKDLVFAGYTIVVSQQKVTLMQCWGLCNSQSEPSKPYWMGLAQGLNPSVGGVSTPASECLCLKSKPTGTSTDCGDVYGIAANLSGSTKVYKVNN
ncbi:hypothetical protein BC940DRAFT_317353 [Gongronella butleri]|nr:hypothetical protein BC940DRAFT_317353 [Gongronella butleri]